MSGDVQPSQLTRESLLSDQALEALTMHLQIEWAGPYYARVADYLPEGVEGEERAAAIKRLQQADRDAHEEAKAEARRAMEAVLEALRP